jgi:multidrug resistance efflux pump
MLGIGKKDRELDAAAEELARADTLAFGGVGIAGQILPATDAYRHVEQALREQPEAARKKVDRLLKHGSPAGKAYAATLLETVDPAAGRAAWERLRADDGEFTTFSGCIMGRATLREYAAERLADPDGS